MSFAAQPTESEVREQLKAMYRTLLSGQDADFFKIQGWVFELSESEWMDKYSQNLQDDICGCLDQYTIGSRHRASDRYPGPDWIYPYFLD
jgi:hypothetical protein